MELLFCEGGAQLTCMVYLLSSKYGVLVEGLLILFGCVYLVVVVVVDCVCGIFQVLKPVLVSVARWVLCVFGS